MAGYVIKINGEDADLELRSLGRTAIQSMRNPIYRGMLRAEALLKNYPSAPGAAYGTYNITRFVTKTGRGVAFVSAPRKPYRRTGDLGRSWTAPEITMTESEVSGEVGTNISYAKWVQGAETQVSYHVEHGWATDRTVLEQVLPQVVSEIGQAIGRAVQ